MTPLGAFHVNCILKVHQGACVLHQIHIPMLHQPEPVTNKMQSQPVYNPATQEFTHARSFSTNFRIKC